MRVAVIGAGIAGLSAAKNSMQYGLDVVVYEQSEAIGGTWVYTDDIGTTKCGIDVHSSMYKGLKTNLPKEVMGFPDFPFPEQDLSYIPASDVLKFLKSYAEKFNINDNIIFKHHIIRVRPFQESKWEIIVKDLSANKYYTEIFDSVFVCNGHYSTPSWPKFPGQDLYQGRQIHSHDYRCADAFKDDTVLVIGAGPSGFDIAFAVSKTAERVTHSHHLKLRPPNYPKHIRQTDDLIEITANGVRFADGTYEEFTVIIHCTGYKYTFPFLSVDCGISANDNYVQPLFKHCLNINNPTMGIIGLPFKGCITQMVDMQVRFCLQFMSGKLPLPSRKEMLDDTEKEMRGRWERGLKTKHAHLMEDQRKYYDEMSSTADIENIKPVMINLYSLVCMSPFYDLLNFRNNRFRLVDDEKYEKIN